MNDDERCTALLNRARGDVDIEMRHLYPAYELQTHQMERDARVLRRYLDMLTPIGAPVECFRLIDGGVSLSADGAL